MPLYLLLMYPSLWLPIGLFITSNDVLVNERVTCRIHLLPYKQKRLLKHRQRHPCTPQYSSFVNRAFPDFLDMNFIYYRWRRWYYIIVCVQILMTIIFQDILRGGRLSISESLATCPRNCRFPNVHTKFD